jgi:hypothetical protein
VTCSGSFKLVWHRMGFCPVILAAVGGSAVMDQEMPRIDSPPRCGIAVAEAAADSKERCFILQHSHIVHPAGGVKPL